MLGVRSIWAISVLASILILGSLGLSQNVYAASFTPLGDLPGGSFTSFANGISSDGSVVVGFGSSASGLEAFRWTSGGMVGLGDLPGGSFGSQARDTSSDGSVVVGFSSSASGGEAFIWDSTNGMQNLNTVLTNAGVVLTGYTLLTATDISDDGTKIVGFARGPLGLEAFLVELPLPPEEQAQNLIEDVEDLLDDETLNAGNANALIKKLEGVIKNIEQGDTDVACNELETLIDQVEAFVNSGKLSSPTSDDLISAVNEIKDSIPC